MFDQPVSSAPTGADVAAAKLAAAGCKRAFGVPGGEVLALIEGLRAAGIAFHLTKHENAAGFMAEGGWHADCEGSGHAAPGLLVATVGPGVANAVNVVANAMQDRVPMLFLTGCVDAWEAHSYTHQVFDHQAMLRPVVKASFRAEAGSVGVVVEKALAIAAAGQPGPVHVDLPISALEGAAIGDDLAALTERLPPAPALGAPAGEALTAARALLSGAERPLVIAGVDAVNEGAGEAVARFCRQLGAPLVTSYKGKGLLDEADPLALGGAGLSPKADTALAPLLAAADLILLAGYDPIEMRKGWRRPWPTATPVIEIAPVLRDHGMHTAPRVSFQTALPGTLDALADNLPSKARWSDSAPTHIRAKLRETFSPEPDWGPARAFHTLRDVLPPETVATADSGAHRILLSQIWRCPSPRGLLQSSALCTMGCAVPLAMGHALARPDVPAVAFVGDAGLEMGLGELATARDLKLPVLIVTLVDESLALIEMKQRAGQRPNVGVDFPGSNFPAIAEAMGGVGVWIDDETSLRAEAAKATGRETFTLLAVRIGRRAYDGKF
ncbi:MAG: thiamine pyrophosphate-binding protein [Rhodobacteraceae bacterium]|nr:thiamine pyrophosphate-binding protein [Paracoccaceae bacterium]